MKLREMHTRPSTYVALAVWGSTGFMAQPTIASFAVHFVIAPLLIFLMLWLAHWEVRQSDQP